MSWFKFLKRGDKIISTTQMIMQIRDKGYLVADLKDHCDKDAPNTKGMRDFLRKGGWVVMYLEPNQRKCTKRVCWMEMYNKMEHNKGEENEQSN